MKEFDAAYDQAGGAAEDADRSSATPVKVTWHGDRPVVEWADFGALTFTDPFFSDTYARLQQASPASRTWETDGEELVARAGQADALNLSGFIFHMGRCGSTLTSRVLATSNRLLVMSEPDPMVGMLDFPASVGEAERRTWVRALVTVLAQRRRPTETGCVVKLTSYHVLHLDLLTAAFPRTPWIFVARDPVPVMLSVMRRPSGLMFLQDTPYAAALIGVSPADVVRLEREEYLARFLDRMLEVPLRHEALVRSGRAMVVDYDRLPASIWDDVAPFFGLSPTGEERARMETVSRLYSKDPTSVREFRPDPEAATDVIEKAFAFVEPTTRERLTRRYRRVRALAGLG